MQKQSTRNRWNIRPAGTLLLLVVGTPLVVGPLAIGSKIAKPEKGGTRWNRQAGGGGETGGRGAGGRGAFG